MKGKTPDKCSDEELLRRMLAGEGAAFAALYQRWQPSVFKFSLRMSGSGELAEDVTQDVFLPLMRDGAQYAEHGSFAAYLLTMARHSVLRHLQRERCFMALPAEDESNDVPLPDDSFDAADPLAEKDKPLCSASARSKGYQPMVNARRW